MLQTVFVDESEMKINLITAVYVDTFFFVKSSFALTVFFRLRKFDAGLKPMLTRFVVFAIVHLVFFCYVHN